MRNVPNKVVGDTYTSQELNEGGLDEDKNMITDTLQNFDNTSVSQKMQAVILAAGNRLTYIENTGSTGSAYKVKNLQSTSDQAKFIQNGFKFTLIFTNENTVINPTIEFDGILGTYNIVDKDSNPIKLSLFKANSIVEFVYNGTKFLVASVLTSQEDINKNNFYTSVYTSPNYLLTNNVANPTAYYDGMIINFVANSKSDTAVTITINGLSSISLVKAGGELSYNDILLGSLVSASYYGGKFYLMKNKDNFISNSNNTYSSFDNDNISRKSAFNIGGLAGYSSNVTLTALQSHQKIKIANTANVVQITLPQWSTCDDNCEFPVMVQSSLHAASIIAHTGELINYNGVAQASINLLVDNGIFLIKKDLIANTWFMSGYSQSNGAVVGSISQTVVNTIPNGYLYCDGSAFSRVQYARLFSAIGTSFGAGDGVTTFNVPDFRGSSLKGAGASTSSPIGTMQGDAIRNITGELSIGHCFPQDATGAFNLTTGSASNYGASNAANSGIYTFDASTQVPTAVQNYVQNYSVYFYIKY